MIPVSARDYRKGRESPDHFADPQKTPGAVRKICAIFGRKWSDGTGFAAFLEMKVSFANQASRLGLGFCSVLLVGSFSASLAEQFSLPEAGLPEISAALDQGVISSTELTFLYLNRYLAYDRFGPRLNAIPVLNPEILNEAMAADAERATGQVRSPLHGIPYTVKDSFMVKGLTVAAGSPAFADIIAPRDAFAVEKLREGGALMLGKTNMPPMASGGMQRGVYGRAENPYNPAYLSAARGSGSSNGAGVSTATYMAAFALGEETVSSGRTPASNSGLVAYTPSWGMISIRGNWPLFADRDVVVPITRTTRDLASVLDILMVSDPVRRGDFWLEQQVIPLPTPESIRPETFHSLIGSRSLEGVRLAAPKALIGKGVGKTFNYPLRPSVAALFEEAVANLRAAGAVVEEVELPLIYNYHDDIEGQPTYADRGLLPAAYWVPANRNSQPDRRYLWNWYLEQFLADLGDPRFPSWADIDGTQVFPYPPGSVDAQRQGPFSRGWAARVETIREGLIPPPEVPGFADFLRGLVKIQELEYRDWLKENGFVASIFPAIGNVGKADSDYVAESYDEAMSIAARRGQTDHVMRAFGLPSLTIPMGILADAKIPMGLTFMGATWDDVQVFAIAEAYERLTQHAEIPSSTPPLPGEIFTYDTSALVAPAARPHKTPPTVSIFEWVNREQNSVGGHSYVDGAAQSTEAIKDLRVSFNGHPARVERRGQFWRAYATSDDLARWGAQESLTVMVLAVDTHGNAAATRRVFTH